MDISPLMPVNWGGTGNRLGQFLFGQYSNQLVAAGDAHNQGNDCKDRCEFCDSSHVFVLNPLNRLVCRKRVN